LFKEFIRRTLHRMGYQLVALPNWSIKADVTEKGGFRLVNYRKQDGSTDLDAYRLEQEKGNRAKIDQVWTNEANLRFLCDWLRSHGAHPSFVLCHGTRNGFEQRIFHEALNCEVIGTEISPTASQFPMTVHHDFHEVRPEWDGKADLVYSNSLDHAYDPAKALNAWVRTVRPGGFIVLDKASDSDPHGISDLDPFGISLPNLLVFVLDALGDKVSVRALLNVPSPKQLTSYHRMIVIQVAPGA
jgi:SAM-dependent methyltransferase